MSSVLGPGRVRTEVVGPEGQSINYVEGEGGGLNQVVQLSGRLGKGVLQYDRGGAMAGGTTEIIFDYPAGSPIILRDLEFATNYAGSSLRFYLRPRKANGAYGEWLGLMRMDGAKAITHWNFNDLIAHGSHMAQLIRYDENLNRYKMSLPYLEMPNGGLLQVRNTSDTEYTVGLRVTVTEL